MVGNSKGLEPGPARERLVKQWGLRAWRSHSSWAVGSFLAVAHLALAQEQRTEIVAAPNATTSVSEVVNHQFSNGDPGPVGYKITHEILAEMAAGESFPAFRVNAAQHPTAFAGQWGDDGYHGAWLAPLGKNQFFPSSTTIESAYFDNYIQDAPFGNPLSAGDSVEIAVKQLPGNTPLTWSREKSTATGELSWEIATRITNRPRQLRWHDGRNGRHLRPRRARLARRRF